MRFVDLKWFFLELIILYTKLYPKVSPAFQLFPPKQNKYQNNRYGKNEFFQKLSTVKYFHR